MAFELHQGIIYGPIVRAVELNHAEDKYVRCAVYILQYRNTYIMHTTHAECGPLHRHVVGTHIHTPLRVIIMLAYSCYRDLAVVLVYLRL